MRRFLKFVNCKKKKVQNTWNFVLFQSYDLQLLQVYYFDITLDADSTYKQAIKVYGVYMHRVKL